MQRHGQGERLFNHLHFTLAGAALLYILLPALLQRIGLELGLVNTRVDLACVGEVKNGLFSARCTVYNNPPMQEFSRCMKDYRIFSYEDRYSPLREKTNIAAWFKKTESYNIPLSQSVQLYNQPGPLFSCAKESKLQLQLEKINRVRLD